MQLDRLSALLNPTIDLDLFVNTYLEKKQLEYQEEEEEVYQELKNTQAKVHQFTQELASRLSNIDIGQGIVEEIALYQERLQRMKSVENTQLETLEKNDVHLQEGNNRKQTLIEQTAKAQTKLSQAEAKLNSQKPFYEAAHAALAYVSSGQKSMQPATKFYANKRH